MRNNRFVRWRRWDQRPPLTEGWYMVHPTYGEVHASRHNANYGKDYRRQSWRRPL